MTASMPKVQSFKGKFRKKAQKKYWASVENESISKTRRGLSLLATVTLGQYLPENKRISPGIITQSSWQSSPEWWSPLPPPPGPEDAEKQNIFTILLRWVRSYLWWILHKHMMHTYVFALRMEHLIHSKGQFMGIVCKNGKHIHKSKKDFK